MLENVSIPPRVATLRVRVKVLLGTTRIPLDMVSRLERGTIVLLPDRVTDPVRGYAGPIQVFTGQVVSDHGNFAVKLGRNLLESVEPGRSGGKSGESS